MRKFDDLKPTRLRDRLPQPTPAVLIHPGGRVTEQDAPPTPADKLRQAAGLLDEVAAAMEADAERNQSHIEALWERTNMLLGLPADERTVASVQRRQGLFSISDAATYCGVSTRKMAALIDEGHIQATVPPGMQTRYVTVEALDLWRNANSQ